MKTNFYKLRTSTRFEGEADMNSEMTYLNDMPDTFFLEVLIDTRDNNSLKTVQRWSDLKETRC